MYEWTISCPIVLSKNMCAFKKCTFQGAATNKQFVSANDPSLKCSFLSCLFAGISIIGEQEVIRIMSSAKGILDKCCFSEISPCLTTYGTGVESSYALPSAFINSTACTKCSSVHSPYSGGFEHFAYFYNNNSYVASSRLRSCYCMVRTPQNREDVSCFFLGVSCDGPYPVSLHSDVSGCIGAKMNFVNNTDSSGFFRLVNGYVQSKMKDAVISFKSASPKWIWSAASNARVILESTFVISEGDFPSESQFVTDGVLKVSVASTYRHFQSHPPFIECNPASLPFSPTILLIIGLIPMSIASLTLSAR